MLIREINEFRNQVAAPRLQKLFDSTVIPEGFCCIDNLQISLLDGRSCGIDSEIVASGFVYRNGRVEKYIYDEPDVSISDFVDAHRNCTLLYDGKLVLGDHLENLEIHSTIGNINTCALVFSDFSKIKTLSVMSSSIEYEKMKYLYQEQAGLKASVAEQIEEAASDAVNSFDSVGMEVGAKSSPNHFNVSLSNLELAMIIDSLDVLGDRVADHEGYSSGEAYWDLRDKLDEIHSASFMKDDLER